VGRVTHPDEAGDPFRWRTCPTRVNSKIQAWNRQKTDKDNTKMIEGLSNLNAGLWL